MTAIFNDSNWEEFRAPVTPPQWVIEWIVSTDCPVAWKSGENCPHDETLPKGNRNWQMFYVTKRDKNNLVTHLLPGSVQPVNGWLQLVTKTPIER